jgi:hypothetical protein
MARQAKFLREGIEDQLILEQAKGAEGLTREQLAEAARTAGNTAPGSYVAAPQCVRRAARELTLPRLSPALIVIGYFFFSLLGFL